MIDLLRGSSDQVAKRSQLFFLDELGLQLLLTLVSTARFFQERHQSLILEILAQEDEASQQQHATEHGEDAEGAGGGRRAVEQHGPKPQNGEREDREHGELGNELSPAAAQVEVGALQVPIAR
jgi:hypothetical protein